MANVALKQPIVEEIHELIDGAATVVAVDYRGLTVAQDTELRRNLRAAGVTYKVYKNSMIKRAAEGTEVASLDPVLEGPTAIAIHKDDATAAARVLAEFGKKADKLEIKGGIVEGKFYDANGMMEIAAIPPRDILLGRLFGSMQSPIANLARVLNQIAEKGGAGETSEEPAAAEEAPVAAEETPAAAEEAPAAAEEAPAAAEEAPAAAEEAPAADAGETPA